MTTFYVFLQWAKPAWLLVILASAVSVGLLLTVLSIVHNWLADQFFILDESDEDEASVRQSFEIPVNYISPEAL